MINRQKIASLFIIAFFGVILMKPVHFLFVDHDESHYTTHPHADGKSAAVHQDCDICLFMFQAFTPQQFAELQHYFDVYFAEIIQTDVQTWAYQFLPHISLRAPPVEGLY